MSYTQNRARRGPPPAPFHENLRRHVDGLGMPQPAIADAYEGEIYTRQQLGMEMSRVGSDRAKVAEIKKILGL